MIGDGPMDGKPNLPKVCLHLKHRKREPEAVHACQIEGCNRNLRPKDAVVKVYTHVRSIGFSVDWAFGLLVFGRIGCNRKYTIEYLDT